MISLLSKGLSRVFSSFIYLYLIDSRAALNPEASHSLWIGESLRVAVTVLAVGWLTTRGEAQGSWEVWALLSLPALLQVSGHLDYARQMDVILKAVGIRTKPSWDEKGLLLAPGRLPPEESRQAAATSSSDQTTNQDGQTQGPTSRDTPKAATPPDLSQAPVPAGLDQSEGASLPAATSPAESPPLCSHGLGANPLGCPDCASETQGPCPGLV